MEDVDRFLSDLTDCFQSHPEQNELKRFSRLQLAAFIGRVASRGPDGRDEYAGSEDIAVALREARARLQNMPNLDGRNFMARTEIVGELDKVLVTLSASRIPPPNLHPQILSDGETSPSETSRAPA